MYHDHYYIPDGPSREQIEQDEMRQWIEEQELNDFAQRLQHMTPQQARQIAEVLMAADELCNYPEMGIEKLNETLGDCDVQFPELV